VTFVLIEKIHSYIYISKETKKSIILKRNDQETPKIIPQLILVVKKSLVNIVDALGTEG